MVGFVGESSLEASDVHAGVPEYETAPPPRLSELACMLIRAEQLCGGRGKAAGERVQDRAAYGSLGMMGSTEGRNGGGKGENISVFSPRLCDNDMSRGAHKKRYHLSIM